MVKKIIMICVSVSCLSVMASPDLKSKDFKVKVAKNKLESLEIRIAKNTTAYKQLNLQWIKQVRKLKELGVETNYDFDTLVK